MKRFVLLMFTVLFIIFSAVSVFAADTNGSGEVNAEDLAWLRYMLIDAEK